MNLVVDQMVQFQHIDAADCDAVLKRLARAPVVEHRLAVVGQPRCADRPKYIVIARTVKDGGRNVDSGHVGDGHPIFIKIIARRPKIALHRRVALLDALSEHAARHAEMRLEHLPDVHARRNAERVQHDIDRRAVRQERHILLTHDA